jgi:hypothetical protein
MLAAARFRSQRCSMATYVIVQDGAFFTVKLGDVSPNFSNLHRDRMPIFDI